MTCCSYHITATDTPTRTILLADQRQQRHKSPTTVSNTITLLQKGPVGVQFPISQARCGTLMTRDRQPAIRVSRFVFQGCGCGLEKGWGIVGIVSAGNKRRKRSFFQCTNIVWGKGERGWYEEHPTFQQGGVERIRSLHWRTLFRGPQSTG
jgi:hypothetical protein